MFKWFRKESDVKALEKDLASLASKINKQEASLSQLRANARRFKGAITLYCALFYAVYFAIWLLFFARNTVHGRKWMFETLPVVLGPVVIYLFRSSVAAYYQRRLTSAEGTLDTLKSQQKEKIEEFKTKTDFYTTKSLIDRYSGADTASQKIQGPKVVSSKPLQPDTPTNLQKPLQADRVQQGNSSSPRFLPQSQLTPQRMNPASLVGTVPTPASLSGTPVRQYNEPPKIAEFAANADAPTHHVERHWYDRMLDIIVGEDEGNESSRYKLEHRLRERDEKIAGLELELLKLRKVAESQEVPEQESKSNTPEKHSTDSSEKQVTSKIGSSSVSKGDAGTKTRQSKRNQDVLESAADEE